MRVDPAERWILKKTQTVAIFDLDKTLLPFDCDEAWGLHLYRLGLTAADFLERQRTFFDQYDQGTLDIHEYQAFSLAAIIQAGPTVARQELAWFVKNTVAPQISPLVHELIDSHRQQGHELLVITATNQFVSRAVVDLFSIQDLLAIDLEVGPEGWYTGKIVGIPSFREGKVDRFRAWLSAKGLTQSDVYTYFYSDSMNDLPLLNQVNVAVATNPSLELMRHAEVRKWRVLDIY
jgi:HAD superfamily hydrolase (TIGR01490 family)